MLEKNPQPDREYLASTTLMVLGEDLDPDTVSAALGLEASQCWRKGERFVRRGDGTTRIYKWAHERGGWKLFVATEQKDNPLEEQLEFWLDLLRSRISGLRRLTLSGLECALDIFVISSNTASIVIPNRLQQELSALGLEWRISFYAHPESEPAPPNQDL